MAGKQFATDADMKQAVTGCLQTLDTNFFLCWDTSPGIMMEQILKYPW
jgi:hypothetical protein